MTRFTSRRARSLALLIDGTFILALFWPTWGCDFTPVLPPSAGALQSTGRVLWELAYAQEVHRDTHGQYASRVADLAPRPGWQIVIVRASASSYRMRISNRTDTCTIWGGRTQATGVQPFHVNCGMGSEPPGAG